MRLTGGDAVACGTQDIVSFVVQNESVRSVLNQPQVPWMPRRVFSVTIGQTGSFRAEQNTAYIAATASQGHMQGQIVGDSCGFQFEADTTGTF